MVCKMNGYKDRHRHIKKKEWRKMVGDVRALLWV